MKNQLFKEHAPTPPQALLDVSECYIYGLIYQPVLAEEISELPSLFLVPPKHCHGLN